MNGLKPTFVLCKDLDVLLGAPRTGIPIIKSDTYLRGRLCGLVVRVPGYRSRGPGFDS
jgi:hypothetical protein